MADNGKNIALLKRGQRVALTATALILLLAVTKFAVGYVFNSNILIADAFHSGVDTLAVFASWFGLNIASKKGGPRFPYGLYRAETFVTLVIGLLIAWVGVQSFLDGYEKLFQPSRQQLFPVLPVLACIVSAFVSYYAAKIERETGSAIGSGALQANAAEAFLDIGASLVALVGIVLAYMRIAYIEGSIIIFIAILIFRVGIRNIWTPIMILMDANLDPDLQNEIERRISSVEGVRAVGDIKIRQSGPFKIVECNVATAPAVSVYKAHELADKIENIIKNDFSGIDSVFVHVEPQREETLSAIMPVEEVNGLDSIISEHFGRSPYFIILKLDDKGFIEIEDFYFNEFLGKKEDVHIGVKVIKAVIKHNLDVVFTPKIGEIAFYMLKDNFIDIYKAHAGTTVCEVLEEYRNGHIEKITVPHPAEESEKERQYTQSQ